MTEEPKRGEQKNEDAKCIIFQSNIFVHKINGLCIISG